MTILYRPVLIESTEQAEALPIGTVARIEYTEHGMTDVTVRVRGGWDDNHPQATGPLGHGEVIGWTALVPIEAEEVRVIEHGLIELDVHGQEALYREPTPGSRDYRRTEYRTPWEEA